MSKGAGEKRERAKILRWRGVMSGSTRVLRLMTAVVLAVAGIALTGTQLGFVSVTLPNGTIGYIVVLLQVVALGALLLGTIAGVALGLATGGALLVHARLLPLDHYELTFITPLTSIVMFGISGLLLGCLFAFVLRKNPSQVKRVIYIALVCIVVSLLYSVGFVINAIVSLGMDLYNQLGADIDEAYVQSVASQTVLQFGDLRLQIWATAGLMILLCCVGDYMARRVIAFEGALGLRTVFGTWLAVVVLLAFMTMSAMSFAVTSADELHDAELSMSGEAEYLCGQLDDFDARADFMIDVLSEGDPTFEKVDDDTIRKLADLFSAERLLDNYTVDSDGSIILVIGGHLFTSNDPRYIELEDAPMSKAFGYSMIEAIDRSLEDDEITRFVMNDTKTTTTWDEGAEGVNPSIAYLFARRTYAEFEPGSVDDEIVIIVRTTDQVFSQRNSVMMWMTLSSLVLLLVVFAIVIQLLNRVVARRIDEENEALERVTAGELETRAQAGGTREFESLSEGINTTVDTLRGWIAEAEARMDTELATAKAIQEETLPRTFPPFPDIRKFDIYASMNAARQVGGDFYDFFLIGDDCDEQSGKLGFLVADVSGKGVPAALFMMKAKALLHDYVASGLELGEAVEEANRQLVDGNDEGMFVTAWVGVLDYGSGHVDYVNAGHNPPLLWQRDGGWHWMREKSGTVLGLFEFPYQAHSVECRPGETFVLYTDGVTEAFNVDEQLYGEDRLLAVVEEGYRLHPRALLETVRDDVAAYAQGAEQSDDITILTLEVGVPPEVTSALEVPAKVGELDRVNEFLHAELERRLCPMRARNQLDIAVEELFVNVCRYAYPDATPEKPGTVRVQHTYSAEPQSIVVDIIDEGIPYDPLAKPDAVTPTDIADVPIGGLGILMAKRSVDEMRYERVNNCNVVTIVKMW